MTARGRGGPLVTQAAAAGPAGNRAALASEINRRARLSGEFRLRSGATSAEYFDKYRFEADPRLLADVAAAVAALLPDGVDALAGLELGGIPLATAVSALTGLPARFVRKQAKTYGTCRLAEGGEISKLGLVVIEDVVTSGGQVIESVDALRARGASVEIVVCVIDREAGGRANLAAVGIELRSVFTASELDSQLS
jgi:orotate phosphoribosyltransferase